MATDDSLPDVPQFFTFGVPPRQPYQLTPDEQKHANRRNHYDTLVRAHEDAAEKLRTWKKAYKWLSRLEHENEEMPIALAVLNRAKDAIEEHYYETYRAVATANEQGWQNIDGEGERNDRVQSC